MYNAVEQTGQQYSQHIDETTYKPWSEVVIRIRFYQLRERVKAIVRTFLGHEGFGQTTCGVIWRSLCYVKPFYKVLPGGFLDELTIAVLSWRTRRCFQNLKVPSGFPSDPREVSASQPSYCATAILRAAIAHISLGKSTRRWMATIFIILECPRLRWMIPRLLAHHNGNSAMRKRFGRKEG
jgi:hypothetical protein